MEWWNLPLGIVLLNTVPVLIEHLVILPLLKLRQQRSASSATGESAQPASINPLPSTPPMEIKAGWLWHRPVLQLYYLIFIGITAAVSAIPTSYIVSLLFSGWSCTNPSICLNDYLLVFGGFGAAAGVGASLSFDYQKVGRSVFWQRLLAATAIGLVCGLLAVPIIVLVIVCLFGYLLFLFLRKLIPALVSALVQELTRTEDSTTSEWPNYPTPTEITARTSTDIEMVEAQTWEKIDRLMGMQLGWLGHKSEIIQSLRNLQGMAQEQRREYAFRVRLNALRDRHRRIIDLDQDLRKAGLL